MPFPISLLGGKRKGADQGGDEGVRVHGFLGYGWDGLTLPAREGKVKICMTGVTATSLEEVTGRREFKGESRTRQIAGPVHFGVVKKLHFLLPAYAALVSCDKNSSAGAPKAVEVREEVVAIPSPEDPKTPGEHLDKALQKTGQGLQVAGEKTEECLKTAKEKTEAGLDKAAEATGKFLKRVGEEIENQAEKPVPPVEEP